MAVGLRGLNRVMDVLMSIMLLKSRLKIQYNYNMNVARVLFCRKTKPFFRCVVGQEDNDSEELTEEPWNYARGDTLEDTKWHQLKIGSLKYFSTLKSDRYKTGDE